MRYRAALFAYACSTILGICQAQSATLQDAAGAHERGDYNSAREIFQSLAEQGDVTAQFDLAVMNAKGEGAPPNLQEALKWYRAAAEQGDAESFVSLAALFESGSGMPVDHVKAYVLLDMAARFSRANTAPAVRASRDSLSAKMPTEQLIQAQELARQCQAFTAKGCSELVMAFSPGNQGIFPIPVAGGKVSTPNAR